MAKAATRKTTKSSRSQLKSSAKRATRRGGSPKGTKRVSAKSPSRAGGNGKSRISKRKAAAKKSASKKKAAKRKKSTARKTVSQKKTARKAGRKNLGTVARKTPAKKATGKRTTAKKATAKKTTGKRTTAKKATAKGKAKTGRKLATSAKATGTRKAKVPVHPKATRKKAVTKLSKTAAKALAAKAKAEAKAKAKLKAAATKAKKAEETAAREALALKKALAELPYHEGQFVVHPKYGLGRIEYIHDRKLSTRTVPCLDIRFSYQEMRLTIPVDQVARSGLRRPISRRQIDEVFHALRGRATFDAKRRSAKRVVDYRKRLSRGDPISLAEVIRDLGRLSLKKSLSYEERKILGTALRILSREVALARGREPDDVREEIEKIVYR